MKTILNISLIYFVIVCYFVYLSLEIWNRGGSVQSLFIYGVYVYGVRLVAMPIVGMLILQNKNKLLLQITYVCSILLGLSVIFLDSYLVNIYAAMFVYGTLVGVLSLCFILSTVNMESIHGEEKYFTKYFYIKSFMMNIVQFFSTILIGFLIMVGYKSVAFGILILISVVGLYQVSKLKDGNYFDKSYNLLDMYKIERSPVDKKINKNVLLYVLVSLVVLQVLDTNTQTLKFLVGENALTIGFINAAVIVLIYGFLKLKNKLKVEDYVWYIVSVIGIIIAMVGTLYIDSVLGMYLLIIEISIVFYLYSNSNSVIAFSSVDGKDNLSKFYLVFNREVIRNIGRVGISVLAYLISFETFQDDVYIYFVFVVIISLLISAYLYWTIYNMRNKE